ncbi:MAG: ABC transporter permease [Chthoniobacteraceae bacterium]|nr:ABC transporter permease [Chthoniobacteraceae bacterium]
MNIPNNHLVRRLFSGAIPYGALACILLAAVWFPTPDGRPVSAVFLTWDNARFAAAQGIVTGLGALGMGLILLSGGIDLSAGAAALLSGIVTALLFQSGASAFTALGAGMLAGGALGLLNGSLAALLPVPPWALTLGTLAAARGAALWLAAEAPVPLPDRAGGLAAWVGPFSGARWMPCAPGVWIVLLGAALLAVLWRGSVFGRHAAAVGSSETAARLCGVPIRRTKVFIYTLAGFCFGLAGVAQAAATGQASPAGGSGLALEWIAAAVLGGVRLGGGAGSLWGALLGAAVLTVLHNACQQAGWPVPLQQIVLAGVLIAAVALDRLRHGLCAVNTS